MKLRAKKKVAEGERAKALRFFKFGLKVRWHEWTRALWKKRTKSSHSSHFFLVFVSRHVLGLFLIFDPYFIVLFSLSSSSLWYVLSPGIVGLVYIMCVSFEHQLCTILKWSFLFPSFCWELLFFWFCPFLFVAMLCLVRKIQNLKQVISHYSYLALFGSLNV